MTDNQFIEALQERIAEKNLLQHPFYQMWTEGTLPKDALRLYAAQYYQHVWNFPACLALAHAACDDPAHRASIARNLADEEADRVTHPELWLQFAASVGADRDEARNAEPLPETQELLDTFRQVSSEGTTAEAAALFYAYESQVPQIAEEKIRGLQEHFGIDTDEALEYFKLHGTMDVAHSQEWKTMILEETDDDSSKEQALDACGKSADALWRFLDGVMRASGLEPAAC